MFYSNQLGHHGFHYPSEPTFELTASQENLLLPVKNVKVALIPGFTPYLYLGNIIWEGPCPHSNYNSNWPGYEKRTNGSG